MGWRHDEKKARNLAESDPAAALPLLDAALDGAKGNDWTGPTRYFDLLELKAETAQRANRADIADAARAQFRSELEAAIAEKDAIIDEGKGGVMKIAGAMSTKADFLERLGERTDANRLRLQSADLSLAAIGDEGAKVRLAATPFYVISQGAMGLETGRAFQKGWESNYKAQAEGLRDPLLASGDAVGLAWCKKCGDAVEADWKKGKCVRKHKVDTVRVVIAEDADMTREELRGVAAAA